MNRIRIDPRFCALPEPDACKKGHARGLAPDVRSELATVRRPETEGRP
jgi:hypothetical protein